MWWLLSFVVAGAMSHLLAFCRESHFVANTRFLGLCCADFYADIWDLTQILRRYLDQKSAADSSGIALVSLEKWRSYDCPISTQPSPRLILSVRTSCKRDLFLFSFILSFWSITERIVLDSVFESHRSCIRLAAASYEVIHNMKSRQDMNFNFSQSVLDRIPKAKRSTRSLSGGSRPFSKVSFKTIWFEAASTDAYFEQYWWNESKSNISVFLCLLQ